ncbi:MAG: DUF4105 domain-containing protein [Bacteroidales bacterium]
MILYNRFKRSTMMVLFALIASLQLYAYPKLSERSRVTLLTECGGQEIYALWGHTALRVADDSLGVDDVFNYGIFDFTSSNFAWRFALGETDYILGVSDMNHVYINSVARGLALVEQTLDLNINEKQRLWESLLENARKENRTYRYSFLYDNCVTRPIEMVEKSLDSQLIFRDTIPTGGTFRQMIHATTTNYPWLKLGIDLVLGAPLDKSVTYREEFFLPVYLMKSLDSAYISGENSRPIVSKRVQLVESEPDDMDDDLASKLPKPMVVISIFTIIWLFVTRINYFEGKTMRAWQDALFFLPYGVAGVIIAFISFVSTHPAAFPNWNILVFNPIQFIYSVLLFAPFMASRRTLFHIVNLLLVVVFFVIYPFIGQTFPSETVLLAIISAIRSFVWIKKGRFSCLK